MDSSTLRAADQLHLGYKESINYAVRISTDGVYLHELDETVWAQGNTDTSHGCLNLNRDNAAWFYKSRSPATSSRCATPAASRCQLWQNGDWSMPWDQWAPA